MHNKPTTGKQAWTGALALAVATLLVASSATATPIDNRSAALDGADRLLEIQFESGAFPWNVESDGEFQNVQGITAQGLLDAYRVSLDPVYLDAAGANAAWLADYMEENPDAYSSTPNAYFLAEYALLSQDLGALDLARQSFDNAVAAWGETPTDLAEAMLEQRAGSYGNLGLWDVALTVRAAQDIGNTEAADEIAAVLLDQVENQTIVDPLDDEASHYTIGLAGLLFGLAEADLVGNLDTLQSISSALQDAQDEDGRVPGDSYGDVQSTAYAAMGFIAVGDVVAGFAACDSLVETQEEDGSWDADGVEYAEADSEAVQALATCTLPARNGATAYADAAVGLL